MIAMLGTVTQPCRVVEACKVFLLRYSILSIPFIPGMTPYCAWSFVKGRCKCCVSWLPNSSLDGAMEMPSIVWLNAIWTRDFPKIGIAALPGYVGFALFAWLVCLYVVAACEMQAQHWTCLRGLVPMPAPSLSGVDHRLFPKLNTLPATNHVSVAAQQQYVQEPQQSPSQAAMITDDSHVHGAACHLSGQGLENDGQDGKHAYEADQHTAWSHSAPGPELNIHGSHKAHDLNSWQDHKVATPPAESQAVHKSRGSSAVGTVSDSAVMRADQSVSTSTRQVSDDQVCAEHVASPADSSPRAHAHVADDSSQHGHRLLADGQDTHAHAAKAVHRTKQASHMCQGKSHQRLLLMTALHVSAQKQMKRQHKHAHAGHVRRQKSI